MKLIHEFVNAVRCVCRFAAGLNIFYHFIIASSRAGRELDWRLFKKIDRQFVFGKLMKIETDRFLKRGKAKLGRRGDCPVAKGFVDGNLEDGFIHIL